MAVLPEVINAAAEALRRVDIREFAMVMERFFEWAELLGLGKFPAEEGARGEYVNRLMDVYADDLAHLPADILEDSLRQVRRRHKWQTLPKPADILECADEELSRRRLIKRRAETAMQAARRETARPPVVPPKRIYSPAEIAAAEAWADVARSKIDAPAKRRDAGELRQIGKRVGFTADELEASRKAAAEALAKRAKPAPVEEAVE